MQPENAPNNHEADGRYGPPNSKEEPTITLKSSGTSARIDSVSPQPSAPATPPNAPMTPYAASAKNTKSRIVLSADSFAPAKVPQPQPQPPQRTFLDPAPTQATTRMPAPSPGFKPTPVRPGGGGIVPPSKRPPTNVGLPRRPDPWHVRYRKALWASGAVASLLLIVGTFFIVKNLGEPESNKIAADAGAVLKPINDEISDANTVYDFNLAAGHAQTASGKMTGLLDRANREVGDQKERTALTDLLNAQVNLLRAYSGPKGADRKKLGMVSRWMKGVTRSSQALIDANSAMNGIDRQGAVDESATRNAADNFESTLTNARRRMLSWNGTVRRQKARRRSFNNSAASLNGYLARLNAQRSEVGRFSDTPWYPGYDGKLPNEFKQDREQLLRSLEAASFHPLLGDAKQSLAEAIRDSADALDDLDAAWISTSPGDKPSEMPAYRTYDREMDDVDSTIGQYNSKLAGARSTAESRYDSPPQPRV